MTEPYLEASQKGVKYGFVLDDNPARQLEVSKLLEDMGYRSLTASSLEEALHKIPDSVEVIVSDLDLSNGNFLSGMQFDGYRFLKNIRKKQEEGNYPNLKEVILYSTFFNRWSVGNLIYPVKTGIRKRVEGMGYHVVPKEKGPDGLAEILKNSQEIM
ncbi:response regulator [Candidatus Woesearchaeota archaeon]|nr:MAG: response regulator [Candidatus Woesearchaeota archaeon]